MSRAFVYKPVAASQRQSTIRESRKKHFSAFNFPTAEFNLSQSLAISMLMPARINVERKVRDEGRGLSPSYIDDILFFKLDTVKYVSWTTTHVKRLITSSITTYL